MILREENNYKNINITDGTYYLYHKFIMTREHFKMGGAFLLHKIRNRITKQKHMCPTYWMKIRQIYQFAERRIEEWKR